MAAEGFSDQANMNEDELRIAIGLKLIDWFVGNVPQWSLTEKWCGRAGVAQPEAMRAKLVAMVMPR